MLKDYIFHYDLNRQCTRKLYHESLLIENGKRCKADISEADNNLTGLIKAYFEDGTELNVYQHELTVDPVIRCKDCVRRGNPRECIVAKFAEQTGAPYFAVDNRGNWFCADGKRADT